MTLYHLSKLIYRLYVEGELRKRFREDPGAILDRFDLTEEEKRIVIEKDYVALYGLGVHPMLVAHYVSVTGGERRFLEEDVPRLRPLRNPFQDYYKAE